MLTYPSQGKIVLSFPYTIQSTSKPRAITLYNSYGKKVFNTLQKSTLQTLDVAHLPRGIYLLEIVSGSEMQVEKVVL